MLLFESARTSKIHTMASLGLQALADLMTRAIGGLESTQTKKKTGAREKLRPLGYYRRAATAAWDSMDMEADEDLDFPAFKAMLAAQDIIMLDPQAQRAFDAIEVSGDGTLSMSEFENFLMLYDIMGHQSNDLLVMDVFDYFKTEPSAESLENGAKHGGLDYSAFLEGLDMLGIKVPEENGAEATKSAEAKNAESALQKTFMSLAKIKEKQIEFTYLTYEQFKTAWLQLCDQAEELRKRKLIPIMGTFSTGKNRERLGRYTQDSEKAYAINLETINDIVDDIKREHRAKTDEKRSELNAYRAHLHMEAEKFKSIRGMEKRLLIKKEQEEKSKKRIEEKIARNKLLLQQAENRRIREEEISQNMQARLKRDLAEVRSKGWDKIDMSVQGLRKLSKDFYDTEDARIRLPYCEILDLSKNKLEALPDKNFLDQFANLKRFKLSQNRVREITNDIRICERLEILELDSNRLTKLPDGICNLRSLQRIDISNNKITGDYYYFCMH